MNKYVGFLESWRMSGLALTVVCGAVVSTGVWLPQTRSDSQDNLPRIKNETVSFQLVSEQRVGDELVVRFKNVSTLTITGYTLSLAQERIGADFFANTSQKGVGPGAVEDVRIPLINLSSQSQKRVTLLTVVFEDRTYEGDFQAAKVILDRRLGYLTQMGRIRSLLFAAAKVPDQDASATSAALLEKLRYRISLLPEQDDQKPSPGMRSGLNFAKQWTLKQLSRLESGEMDLELQRSPKLIEHAELAERFRKVSAGLEYIVEKVDEVIAKL
jgi:hypothetical protein